MKGRPWWKRRWTTWAVIFLFLGTALLSVVKGFSFFEIAVWFSLACLTWLLTER